MLMLTFHLNWDVTVGFPASLLCVCVVLLFLDSFRLDVFFFSSKMSRIWSFIWKRAHISFTVTQEIKMIFPRKTETNTCFFLKIALFSWFLNVGSFLIIFSVEIMFTTVLHQHLIQQATEKFCVFSFHNPFKAFKPFHVVWINAKN